MLEKYGNKLVERCVEKIYPINSRRKTKEGEEYIYKNYEVFIPYDYLELVGITDHMYLYLYENEVYMTSEKPSGAVPAKKLSVHKQRGSIRSRTFQPERTKNNKWKRFFIIPKKFFPYVSEDKFAQFVLDPTERDMFSDKPATLKLSLVDSME